MTSKIFTLALGLLVLFPSCSSDNDSEMPNNMTPSTSINKIMPLGASRVAGARPEYESYRYELWKLLVDSGLEFDFIGTENDDADYPQYAGLSFDRDHEGRGGITSGGIRDEIDLWLNEAGAPDVVLFSSPGGNDDLTEVTYEDVIANINAIVDAIQSVNPNATIIIEQAAPPRSDGLTPEFLANYNRILEDVVTIASEQTTSTSSVLTVDMATGFNDSFLTDDVHYSEAGAVFIANRYYEALENLLQR